MDTNTLMNQRSVSKSEKTTNKGILNFVIYFVGLLYAGLCLNILTSIQVDVTFAYGYSVNQIIYTSSALIFGAIIISVFNSVIIEKIGVRASLAIFFLFQLVPAWARLLLPRSISLVIGTSVIVGVGVGFGLNTILKFCHMWFPQKQRTFYYSFLTLGTLLGSGLGPILPYMFISESNDDETRASKAKEIITYLWATTIFFTIFSILAFIFLKNKEVISKQEIRDAFKDTSYVDDEEEDVKNESLIEDVEINENGVGDDLIIDEEDKQDLEIKIDLDVSFCAALWRDSRNLFTDWNFGKLLILVTISKGSFLLLNSILVIIITNLEYSKLCGSSTIVFGLACGLLGAILYSKNLSQSKNQKFYLLVSLSLALIFLCLSFIMIYFEVIVGFIALYSISCFFSYLMIPNYFSLATKSHFKASLSSVNAYLMLFPQLATFLLQMISSFFFKRYGRDGSYFIFMCLIGLYFISFFILKSTRY